MKNLFKKIRLKNFNDSRGSLFFFQKNNFNINRVFFINGKKGTSRGNHAHKKTRQILININATAKVTIYGKKCKKINLINSGDLIDLPKLTWARIDFIKEGFIAVICDKKYLKSDYINNYSEFIKITQSK